MKTPIWNDLKFSPREAHILCNSNIDTKPKLRQWVETGAINRVRNCGHKTINKFKAYLGIPTKKKKRVTIRGQVIYYKGRNRFLESEIFVLREEIRSLEGKVTRLSRLVNSRDAMIASLKNNPNTDPTSKIHTFFQ